MLYTFCHHDYALEVTECHCVALGSILHNLWVVTMSKSNFLHNLNYCKVAKYLWLILKTYYNAALHSTITFHGVANLHVCSIHELTPIYYSGILRLPIIRPTYIL